MMGETLRATDKDGERRIHRQLVAESISHFYTICLCVCLCAIFFSLLYQLSEVKEKRKKSDDDHESESNIQHFKKLSLSVHWPFSVNRKRAVFLSRQTNFQTIWHEYLMWCVYSQHGVEWFSTFIIWFCLSLSLSLSVSTKNLRFANQIHIIIFYVFTNSHTHKHTCTLIRMKWMCVSM